MSSVVETPVDRWDRFERFAVELVPDARVVARDALRSLVLSMTTTDWTENEVDFVVACLMDLI